MMNSVVVSTRSRIGGQTMFPAHVHHIDVIELTNGGLLDAKSLNPVQKLFYILCRTGSAMNH